jgi:hypothetical protein
MLPMGSQTMQSLQPKVWQLRTRSLKAGWAVGIGLGFMLQPASAAELVQPPICSAVTAGQPALAGICSVASLGNGHNDVKITLTAASAEINVGGYKVTTENYNGNYLTPIVEAMPGDTVSARLVNGLTPNANTAYVYLKSGLSFDFKVPIPGEKPFSGNEMIDARVLDTNGYIPHPSGLNGTTRICMESRPIR